jgi:hypothetical protein
MKSNSTAWIRLLAPVFLALAMPSAGSHAWWNGERIVDGHTRYMWSRTWHGPNALAKPLRQYYIPRTRGHYDSDGYIGDGGCQDEGTAGIAVQYGGLPYPTAAVASFEPMQFERLGRVPNELDILNGPLPAAGAAAPAK